MWRRVETRMRSLLVVVFLGVLLGVDSLKVLVTGAGGRTGKLVFEKLNKDYDEAEPRALVRSHKAKKALKKQAGTLEASAVASGDARDEATLATAMEGCDAVVLCTSAMPKIKLLSIVKLLVKKLLRQEGGRPEFRFPAEGTPEEVDWLGAKAQIDAAKDVGVKHMVFVSSMGGTQPENFLNTIGRKSDGTGGDILLWKRKAERYLVESGLDYTIVHPGGLVDEDPGKREILVGVDDALLELKSRSIPRADVARVCCAALFDPRALNTSFDVVAKPVGQGAPTAHAKDVFGLLELGAVKIADYARFDVPDPKSIFSDDDSNL